jgi:hypothetical protein
MTSESKFDDEFEVTLTKEEAWLLYGVTNEEDFDTID